MVATILALENAPEGSPFLTHLDQRTIPHGALKIQIAFRGLKPTSTNNGHAQKYCSKDMQKNHYIMKYIKLIAG